MSRVVYWNGPHPSPLLRRIPGRISGRIPVRILRSLQRPARNFGDLLGPSIVSLMLERVGLPASTSPCRRLLTVGSIMHLARPGDVVWGSGRNGRSAESAHDTHGLDVRAVRGPRTREWLLDRDVDCPEVFGDPALLLPMLRPDLVELSRQRGGVTFISHIDDPFGSKPRGMRSLSPRADVEEILRAVVQSELVIATSLHPVIVAEAFGVPARSIVNGSETEFKFADYYLSTGRPDYVRASSVAAALELGGERPLDFDPEPLVASFPLDLFTDVESSSTNG